MASAFTLALAGAMAALFAWGFRRLPAARWQVLAAVPVARRDEHHWRGVNYTWYGVFVATGITAGSALAAVLVSAAGMPLLRVAAVSLPLLATGVWLSGALARLLEKRASTFTVVGAVVVTMLLAPWLILGHNRIAPQAPIAVMPALAVFAIAACLGESLGRLGCISFGCCYGAPLSAFGPRARRWLERWAIVYDGPTKKAVYEGHHHGAKLLPVQAMSAVVCAASALSGLWLFLHGSFAAAFVTPVTLSMAWRAACECWRHDARRRVGWFSAYQWIALVAPPAAVGLAVGFAGNVGQRVDLGVGLGSMWDPAVILPLEALWLAVFVYYGRSTVTTATVALHLAERPGSEVRPAEAILPSAHDAAAGCSHPVS